MNSKHQNMRAMWVAQRAFYLHWYEQLHAKALEIKAYFEREYGLVGENWIDQDSGEQKPYIYLLNVEDKPFSADIYDDVSVKGEFLFKLIVVVDHDKQSFPKSLLSIPMMIKFVDDEVQFSIFCTESKKSKQDFGWYRSLSEYEAEITNLIKQDLEFNPMSGFEKKSRMGFV